MPKIARPAPLPAEKAAAVDDRARRLPLPRLRRPSRTSSSRSRSAIDDRGRLWVAEALNYGDVAGDRQGPHRHPRRHRRRRPGRQAHGLLRGLQLRHRHRGRLRRRLGHVAAEPLLHPRPRRRRQARRPAARCSSTASATRRAGTTSPTASPGGRTAGSTAGTAAPARPTSAGPARRPSKRIHCDGGVCRIHPTRLVFENFADGTTNPWGVDFDDYGQCFVSNCVNPHLFHMIQGGHYEPWRNRPSSLYAYERLPTIADHLHYPGGKPQRDARRDAETLAMGGGHAHCGTLVYLGDRFPAEYRNTVFMCNIHGRRINNDILKREGLRLHRQPRQGLHARRRPVVHGRDAAHRARRQRLRLRLVRHRRMPHLQAGHDDRPHLQDQLRRAADGARRSGEARATRNWSNCNCTATTGTCGTPGGCCRSGPREPGWNGTAVHATWREIARTDPRRVPQRLRALWALHVTGGLDAARLRDAARRRERARAGLGRFSSCAKHDRRRRRRWRSSPDLAKHDPSPVVRLYLASALQRLPLEQRWAIAEGLLSHAEDAADANLPLMNWYGIEPLVPADPARALRLGASGARFRWCGSSSRGGWWTMRWRKGDEGDLAPLVAALANRASAGAAAICSPGRARGFAGARA